MEATLRNTGQLPILTIGRNNQETNATTEKIRIPQAPVNISGGPTPPYNYQIYQMLFHFGRIPTNEASNEFINNEQKFGSEHTIDKVRFPGEVSVMYC